MSLEKQINEQLKSIKPSGLLTASKMANDNLKKVNLFLDLASKKQCLNCSNKQCTNLVMPIITENSDVLFIFSTLDEYDMTTHSFYGKGSRLLYSCIPALNIEKYNMPKEIKNKKIAQLLLLITSIWFIAIVVFVYGNIKKYLWQMFFETTRR